MNNITRLIWLSITITLLSDCSWFRGKSTNYEESNSIPPVETPGGLDRNTLGQRYPIPENVSGSLNYTPPQRSTKVPRPQSNVSNTQRNQIKIQSLGDESWILASLPPSEIWPRVNYFLQNIRVPTINTDTQSGIIETSLVQFKGDDLLHQFLIVLEQGVQLQTTEIKLIQRSFITEPRTIPDTWRKKSADVSREQWFRDALANDLASTINDSSVSLVGSNINAKSKVQIISPQSSDPYLALDFSYERAYASVAYSVSRGGFKIVNEAKTKGTFVVTLGSTGKVKKSFWRRMAFWRSSSKPKTYNVNLRVLNNVTEVRISDKRGRSLKRELTEQLLVIIRSNLT